MKSVIVIAIIVLADSAGDVFITKGMKQVGEISPLHPGTLLKAAKKIVINKNFLWALGFFAITFFSFLAILSWADLSIVYPATSLVYVVSTLGARVILKETVTLQRWAGIGLVCLGVALTSLS